MVRISCKTMASALLLIALCRSSACQDGEVLKSRVLVALRRCSILTSTMPPYRLTASIVVFDGTGKNPVQGSFELLHRKSDYRITTIFPQSKSSYLSNSTGKYAASLGDPPYFAAKIIHAFQQPLSYVGFDSKPASPLKDFSKPVKCVAVTSTTTQVVRGPVVPEHKVCIDGTSDSLLAVVDGNETYIREDIREFSDHDVAHKVRLQLGAITVAEATITRFDMTGLTDADFAPDSDMKPTDQLPARIPASVIAGRIIKHENVKYPGAAKAARIQGVVLLHAIIGKDGTIKNLSVISSPDLVLSEAAVKAVNHWTYEPYLLNNEPTEVDTTITVNFALGR